MDKELLEALSQMLDEKLDNKLDEKLNLNHLPYRIFQYLIYEKLVLIFI